MENEIENIFIKTEPIEAEAEADAPKKRGRPKRQLTEKQLEALSKGRAKVKENRLKTSQQLKLEQREQKNSFNTCKAFLDTLTDEEIINEQKRNEKLLIMCRHIKAKMN